MDKISQVNWELILAVLGVISAVAEITLTILDKRRPPEKREKRKGLKIFYALKRLVSSIRKPLYALKKKRGVESKRVFISYKRDIQPDEPLALMIFKALSRRGHKPYIDKDLTVGVDWSKVIRRKIEESDYILILFSESSASSEMVAEELDIAEAYRSKNPANKPLPLPVRVNYLEAFPYHLDKYLKSLHYALWQGAEDDIKLLDAILKAIETGEDLTTAPDQIELKSPEQETSRPKPTADPRLLEIPSGAVALRSQFYIERECDEALERQLCLSGSTTTIRSGRQMGKTSLLVRAVNQARELDYKFVYLDFQQLDSASRSSLDQLLKYLAEAITHRLGLDHTPLDQIWASSRIAADKIDQYLETQVLEESCRLLIAIDEADVLLDSSYKNDFFALIRSWDTRRAFDPHWDCLHVAIVISTHPHLLIDDYMQSPFNVGLRLELEDFTLEQVRELNQRYQSPIKEEQLGRAMALLAGHPYLTRQALYTMVEGGLSWLELETLAASEQGPFRSHLHFYLSQLAKQPKLVQGMKEILATNRCSDENVLYRLSAAGLIREISHTEAELRCGLYQQYFKKTLNA